ncbi:MAG: hypothetical protein ACOZAO_03780 [Patescibacteria group bacterium]
MLNRGALTFLIIVLMIGSALMFRPATAKEDGDSYTYLPLVIGGSDATPAPPPEPIAVPNGLAFIEGNSVTGFFENNQIEEVSLATFNDATVCAGILWIADNNGIGYVTAQGVSYVSNVVTTVIASHQKTDTCYITLVDSNLRLVVYSISDLTLTEEWSQALLSNMNPLIDIELVALDEVYVSSALGISKVQPQMHQFYSPIGDVVDFEVSANYVVFVSDAGVPEIYVISRDPWQEVGRSENTFGFLTKLNGIAVSSDESEILVTVSTFTQQFSVESYDFGFMQICAETYQADSATYFNGNFYVGDEGLSTVQNCQITNSWPTTEVITNFIK